MLALEVDVYRVALGGEATKTPRVNSQTTLITAEGMDWNEKVDGSEPVECQICFALLYDLGVGVGSSFVSVTLWKAKYFEYITD